MKLMMNVYKIEMIDSSTISFSFVNILTKFCLNTVEIDIKKVLGTGKICSL